MTSRDRRINSILFTCLGNICRSPTGEGVMRAILNESRDPDHKQVLVDSCGTGGWHQGQPPHPETIRTALAHGVDLSSQRARQITAADYSKFDLIITMDRAVHNSVTAHPKSKGEPRAEIILLRSFDPEDTELDVPDPYLGNDGFEEVFTIIDRCCRELFKQRL